MKYCVIVPDGMADIPAEALSGATPLEAASTPNMDELSASGRMGMVRTVPRGLRPDSNIAILSILGYDPTKHHCCRAALEALGVGLDLRANETYFRCNLVTLDDDIMADHTAGHISQTEAEEFLHLLNEDVAPEGVKFEHAGDYRFIMVCNRDIDVDVQTTPPQDIIGESIEKHIPGGAAGYYIREVMERSFALFADHDINRVRADLGDNPVSMAWPWGGGSPSFLPGFHELYQIRGAAVAAVPLIKGLALAIGWQAPDIPGATGYYDTDYSAKAARALDLLEEFDIVMVHIEATDEASHEGDIGRKIECIEKIDELVVGPILNAFKKMDEGRILLLPDHPTSVENRIHLDKPVPFAIYGTRITSLLNLPFNERAGQTSDLKVERGHDLMAFFLKR